MKHYKTVAGLFRNPRHWIQGRLAGRRHEEGYVDFISVHAKTADCFCLLGGLHRVYKGRAFHAAVARIVAVLLKLYPSRLDRSESFPTYAIAQRMITSFNDSPYTTVEDVRKAARKAKI